MRAKRRLEAIEGGRLAILFAALGDALPRGRRGALSRLARGSGVDAGSAMEELAALPVRTCSAVEDGAMLDAARCTRDDGCAAAEECPIAIPSRAPVGKTMRSSAAGKLVHALLAPHAIATVAAGVSDFAALGSAVRELLTCVGAFDSEAPPRARTPLALLEAAESRGGPLGVVRAYLSAEEVEQIAAFVPPGAGRGEERLEGIESWIRRIACHEAGLIEWGA